MRRNDDLEVRLLRLLHELAEEFSQEYVVFAIKKLVDRQMLGISIPWEFHDFHPVLKALDMVIREIEQLVFHPETGIREESHLHQLMIRIIPEVTRTDFTRNRP